MKDSIALITPMAGMIGTNKAHKGMAGISANAFTDGILKRISSFMGWRPVSLFFLPEADAGQPANGLYVSAQISLQLFNRLEQNANVFRQTLKNNGLLHRETVIRENALNTKPYQAIKGGATLPYYAKGAVSGRRADMQVLSAKAVSPTVAGSSTKHAASSAATLQTKTVVPEMPSSVLPGESVFVNFRGNKGEIIKHEKTRIFTHSALVYDGALAAAHTEAGTAPQSKKYAGNGIFKRNELIALSHAQMTLIGQRASNKPGSEALPGSMQRMPVHSGQTQAPVTRQSGQNILVFGARLWQRAANMREDISQKGSGSPSVTAGQKTPGVPAVTQNMAPREYKTFQPAAMVMFTPPSYENRYGVETSITSAAGNTGMSRANQEANDFFRLRAAFDAQLDASHHTRPIHGRQYPRSEITYKESAGDITRKLLSQHQDTPKKIDMKAQSDATKSDRGYKLDKHELSKLSNKMYDMLESQVKSERFRHGY